RKNHSVMTGGGRWLERCPPGGRAVWEFRASRGFGSFLCRWISQFYFDTRTCITATRTQNLQQATDRRHQKLQMGSCMRWNGQDLPQNVETPSYRHRFAVTADMFNVPSQSLSPAVTCQWRR